MKITIRVRHGNDNVARWGKITASCTSSPVDAAQRCAMKCAGLITATAPQFPNFKTSGIKIRCLEATIDRSIYEATLPVALALPRTRDGIVPP